MTAPQTPSTAYLDNMEELIAARVAAASPPPPMGETYPGQDELWDKAATLADATTDDLRHIVFDLHANPEV
ncbi:MAG: amidohydrolase, partial [Corynebacterium camporealensis]|nr:amidohydrolase [Corynebacterium camporealensis]